MSAADGLRLGFQWARDEQDAARQAKIDAWTALEQERKRKEWADRDATNATIDSTLKADLESLQAPRVNPQMAGFYDQVGLGAAGVRPPQSFGGVGNDPTVQGNAGLPAGIQPRYQAPPSYEDQPVADSPIRQRALAAAKIAAATRNTDGYFQASGLLAKHDLDAQTAQVQMRAFNATPEQMSRWAQTFTDNSSITGEAQFDPKSGMTTIAMKTGAPVVLNRAQAAEYVAGLWRMKNGDMTGLETIKGISKDLAAAAKDSFDALNKVTETNNSASAKGQTLGLDRQRLANDNARLKSTLDAAKREEWIPIAATETGLTMYNRRDGSVTEKQLPPGVDPKDIFRKLSGGSGGGGGQFKESPQAGTIGTIDGQRVQVQADGSYAAPGAEVDPIQFVAAKYPSLVQSYADKISVTPDGKGLYIGTPADFARMGGRVVAFDYRNPSDMRELEASLRTHATGDVRAGEIATEVSTYKNGMPSGRAESTYGLRPQVDRSIGPKLTNPYDAPGRPGIYAGPEAWAKYRQQQGQ